MPGGVKPLYLTVPGPEIVSGALYGLARPSTAWGGLGRTGTVWHGLGPESYIRGRVFLSRFGRTKGFPTRAEAGLADSG